MGLQLRPPKVSGNEILSMKYVCGSLLLCVLIFYTVFYMICSVCAGAMRIEDFDWKIPFDHKRQPSISSTEYLVNLVSLGITCILSGVLFVPIVRSWVWDYALTVTMLHVCMCCIVTSEFPVLWQWWLEVGCGLLLMVGSGQILAHFTVKHSSHKNRIDF
ncbi:putative transmembrane protein 244 [Rhinophrynus dorsalis]